MITEPTTLFEAVIRFFGISIIVIILVATLRIVWDLLFHGEEMIRKKREAGEEYVFTGMYVDHNGKVVYKTCKRKNLWKFWKH